MGSESAPHVLVVEDHQPTARIVSNVLRQVDPAISTDVVRDGSDCLDVLRGEHDSAAKPDIVLLDLQLLEVDGMTVLENRSDIESLRRTPIVVLSGEDDSETIVQCYDRGANTFFTKPDDLGGYEALAESIVDYWLENAELPNRQAADA